MVPRWGIILDRQLLFATGDEDVARRFMAMGDFRVIDHSTGYYAYIEQPVECSKDLIANEHNND